MRFKQIRSLVKLMHQCFGLLLMVILLLSCLTGLLLVFKDEIDYLINRDMMWLAEPESSNISRLSLEQIELQIKQRYPNSRVSWFDLKPAHQRAAIYWLSGQAHPETGQYIAPEHNQIFIDLSTGEILGGRRWGDWRSPLVNLMPLTYQLHYSLMLGVGGAKALGIACLFWLLQMLLGLYLTWPKGRSIGFVQQGYKWLGYWRFRKGRSEFQARYFRHRWLGLWLSPMMLVFVLSGLAFNLKPLYFAVTDLFLNRQTAHLTLASTPFMQHIPMSSDQALQHGRALMAELAAQRDFQIVAPVGLSYSPYSGHYLYRVHSELDVSGDYARTSIWFDALNGEMKAVYLPTGEFAVDSFTSWISALHMAKAGLWSKGFVILSALAVLLLLVSGVRVMVLKAKRHSLWFFVKSC